jgi:hypothetical protein
MVKIKLEKQIENLERSMGGGGLILPKYNGRFEGYKHDLRRLVGENFGGDAREGFQYDDESQTFSWKSTHCICTLGERGAHRMALSTDRYFRIDPTKPLVEEFLRVAKEREEFQAMNVIVFKALKAAGIDVEA